MIKGLLSTGQKFDCFTMRKEAAPGNSERANL